MQPGINKSPVVKFSILYASPDDTVIGKAALVFPDCEAYAEYCGDGVNTKRLMELSGVELFVLDETRCKATKLH